MRGLPWFSSCPGSITVIQSKLFLVTLVQQPYWTLPLSLQGEGTRPDCFDHFVQSSLAFQAQHTSIAYGITLYRFRAPTLPTPNVAMGDIIRVD